MPIYEYQCQACPYQFETMQKMSDTPLTRCPECGARELRKLVSATAFRLKGNGWYETDFKPDNKRNVVDSSLDSSSNENSKQLVKNPKSEKKLSAESSVSTKSKSNSGSKKSDST